MHILGVSAFYHDSAACLLSEGRIVAAAQEERFTRKKHDASFPLHAARYCVQAGGIDFHDLDYIVFYEKPFLKFDRLLETVIAFAPLGFKAFLNGFPGWLRQKLHIPREIDNALEGAYQGPYIFPEHHESHAASAFFPSPFKEATVLTLDGVGEWTTGSIAHGRDNQIEILQELRFPHSLGLLYSAFTYFTGFRVNSGEYKLMGLAPYGEPIYSQLIMDRLVDLKADGSFRLNMDYFAYCHDDVMTSARMAELFDSPPRKPEAPLTTREMNLAASIQAVTEEIVFRIASHARKTTGCRQLTLAGGVALNCVANGKLLRKGIYDDIWIQPAAGDAGGAIGAAMFAWHQLLQQPRDNGGKDVQYGSLLGPSYGNQEIREFLDEIGAVYEYIEDDDALCDRVADLIIRQNVVGHVAGRMEFGPRALGNRSILGDARSPEMQSTLNLKIKFRESFRPFAPAVLAEHAHEYFDLQKGQESPYMLLVADVLESRRTKSHDEPSSNDRLASLKRVRSEVPAITHVDYSARVQTIDKERNPRFHQIVSRFHQKTGCPMVINTSFNVRGEPIVNTPADAYRCFMGTNMDALVLENVILLKSAQRADEADRAEYLSHFALD